MYLRKITGEYYTIRELEKIMENAQRGQKERVSKFGQTEDSNASVVAITTPQLYHDNKKGEN